MSINNLLPDTLVIAFGHKSGHGKDSCVKAIIDRYSDQFAIRRYAFADALKVELYEALMNPLHTFWGLHRDISYLALPHPKVVYCSDTDKMAWVGDNKGDLGEAMQRYGSYRRSYDAFYWINAMRSTIARDTPKIALISDLRFPNEVLFVQASKGYTVKVVRNGYINPARPGDHPSETELDGFTYDYEIHATTFGIAQLTQDACDLFAQILERELSNSPEVSTDEITTLQAY